MRSELKNIELIENFLLGKLSNEDKIVFETEMKNNSRFQTEIEIQKNLMEIIALNSFITEVKNYHPEFITSNKNGGRGKWFLNSIIVLLVSGVTALAVFFSYNKQSTVKEEKKPQKEAKTISKSNAKLISNTNPSITPISTNTPNITKQNPKKSIPTVLVPEDNREENDLLKKLQVPFEEINMDAQEGKTFFTKASNSKIYFPAGILQHEDGSKVIGEVTIRYREWRNAAEMAFSRIPMTVNENGEEMRFNSAGMIEIRAIQDGEELKIGKETFFTIDYNVTEKLDSCYFWSLNDKTQNWDKLNQLEFGNNSYSPVFKEGSKYINPEIKYKDSVIESEYGYGFLYGKVQNPLSDTVDINYAIKLISSQINGPKYQITKTDTGYFLPGVIPGSYMAIVSADGFNSYTVENVEIIKNKYTELNVKLKPVKIKNHAFYKIRIKKGIERRDYNRKIKDVNSGAEMTSTKNIPLEVKRTQYQFNTDEDGFLAPTLVNDPVNFVKQNKELEAANKNYSNLVTGLKCAGFGVYNCDQVRRMTNPVNVRPSFGSSLPNEKPIKTNYLVLIDKDLNASFNFYTNQFSHSKDGKNIVLIYSGEKVYSILEDDFKKGQKLPNGNTEFKLTDISSQVQSIDDLKKFLKL